MLRETGERDVRRRAQRVPVRVGQRAHPHRAFPRVDGIVRATGVGPERDGRDVILQLGFGAVREEVPDLARVSPGAGIHVRLVEQHIQLVPHGHGRGLRSILLRLDVALELRGDEGRVLQLEVDLSRRWGRIDDVLEDTAAARQQEDRDEHHDDSDDAGDDAVPGDLRPICGLGCSPGVGRRALPERGLVLGCQNATRLPGVSPVLGICALRVREATRGRSWHPLRGTMHRSRRRAGKTGRHRY